MAELLIYIYNLPTCYFAHASQNATSSFTYCGIVMGLALDMAYDSVGIHAAALVFTAYIRNIIIAFLEPFDGYSVADVPTEDSWDLDGLCRTLV
ncbi:MAG: hypothetical protein IPJ39_22315 [Saprospiraceae bacterium]|nr:hypothetical protein [Saprospiraceae bacterium]